MTTPSRLPRVARAVAGVLGAAALAIAVPASAPAATVDANGDPITNRAGVVFGVSAHRGGMAEWPENSLEAYTRSAAAGFDAIETDMVFTSDGHPVMSHSDVLPQRCTNAGEAIHTMTLEQVRLVRCADLAGAMVVPIPTFEQLAAVLADHPGVGLHLEVKSYPGQPASGKRLWAKRAITQVIDHQLLARTKLTSFYWDQALPVFRAYAPKVRVLALDKDPMDLDRVRLADRLGADAYGTRMKYTSVYLAEYVASLGMESAPWNITDAEQRAFRIHLASRSVLLGSDTPTATRAELVGGLIDLDPVPTLRATTLAAPVTVSDITYRAGRKYYKRVGTNAVPTADLALLDDVTLAITVRGGTGKGSLFVGPSSSPSSASVKVALPRGTRVLTVKAPLGDNRKLRISTTATVKLTVRVTGYQRMRFPSAG